MKLAGKCPDPERTENSPQRAAVLSSTRACMEMRRVSDAAFARSHTERDTPAVLSRRQDARHGQASSEGFKGDSFLPARG